MSPENLLITITFSAAFAYLATRLVAAIWGVPGLAPRLRSLLALRNEPQQIVQPARSFDVWVLLLMLLVLELTMVRILVDAASSRDWFGLALPIGHFAFASAWMFYLSKVTH